MKEKYDVMDTSTSAVFVTKQILLPAPLWRCILGKLKVEKEKINQSTYCMHLG